ncbi:IPT/TIG domain-containing protein [Candidatus Caldatribacterium sp. SIUC1]|uniref:IPT/TIG domain-containing protein n=1 Tax=Candidatus Caldatribacterium sp. SIUC1 TaxID=3418365 RepID=UPI003F69166C
MRSMWFLIVALVLFALSGCGNGGAPLSSPSPAPPSITEVHPTCGAPGETVVIKGTGFADAQGGSMVTFNGVPAEVLSWSSTQVTVLVPATTTGDIVVTVNGVSSNGVRFTVPCAVIGWQFSF